jgi:hypothetical protein
MSWQRSDAGKAEVLPITQTPTQGTFLVHLLKTFGPVHDYLHALRL